MKLLTLDDVDVAGKTVGVRVDINSPIIDGKIEISDRIRAHCVTLKELAEKGAKVVVLAHQGRKGEKDYRELGKDRVLLARLLKKKVKYVHDIYGRKAKRAILSLKYGEILLLRNVRADDAETKDVSAREHAKTKLVRNLQPLFDFYVLDGFSVSHRSHTSVVGFMGVENVAGRVMERELKALNRLEKIRKLTYVLGGAKPDDEIPLLDAGFRKGDVDKILAGGVLGELFLIASGYSLGKKDETLLKNYKTLIPHLKSLLRKHRKKIFFPADVAFLSHGKRKEVSVDELPVHYETLDIGKKTIEKYCKEIKRSRAVYFKGPMGMYDLKGFDVGTRKILRAIADSRAFSMMGGGHSLSAAQKFVNIKKISFVSLAGGALLQYLSGKELPGVRALERRNYK